MFPSDEEFANELAEGGIRTFYYTTKLGDFASYMIWPEAYPLLSAMARNPNVRFVDTQGVCVWVCFPKDNENGQWWIEYPADFRKKH